MSIKKAGQTSLASLQMNLQKEIQPSAKQAKVDGPSTTKGLTGQSGFETFGSAGVQVQTPLASTSQALPGGKVTSVLQQTISQLQGVSAIDALGPMSQVEIATIDTQASKFLGRVVGLASERPAAFGESLHQIYGAKLDSTALESLVKQAQGGDFPMPAEIKFVDGDVLKGADAAYSPEDGGTVLLNRSLRDRPGRLQVALTEEIGHHLDKVIGGADSIGDEGELFQRAFAKGGPLTGIEMRAGKFDSDHGTIQLPNGQSLDVEFRSDKTARFYEAQGSFSKVDLRAAGRVTLAEDVDTALLQKFNAAGANVSDIKELKSHLRREKVSITTVRVQAENEIYQNLTGETKSPEAIEKKMVYKFRRKTVNGQPIRNADDVKAYCEQNGRSFERELAYAERKLWAKERKTYTENAGAEVGMEAQSATLIAKLKKGEVLGETTNLDTPLPMDVIRRVEADPVLSAHEPEIDTYGELFAALTTDVDADGKSDFDALQLGRFLPQASQQDILKAIDHPIDSADLKDMLRGAGFEHRLTDRLASKGTLAIDPPQAFGLDGRTDIDRTQQQLLLRTGQIFTDSNEDGKIDDGDAVQYIDSAGTVRETTYGELDTNVKKLVKYNMATAKACEDYAGLPRYQRMKFPHYSSATGESAPEQVNTKFWSVGRADANRGQTSWELNSDTKPSDALNDVFGGNGQMYTTECAQGRTLLRLKGLNNYYKAEFGEGEGTFRFNALFSKGRTDKNKAADFIREFDASGKSWDDFTAANPTPEISYALEVSRHTILGDNEAVIQPWRRASTESAGGDTGYFHNYSVSVEGVKIGYVGENVIDLGFKDGKRQYWGHPGGIQSEEKWSEELGSSRIAVDKMSEYGEYFSSLDIKRGSARVSKERVADLVEENTELETTKPAGWEGTVERNEETIGWWKALDVARQTVATSIDPTKAKAAEDFFQNTNYANRPESFDALLETMTPEGVDALAAGFDQLGKGSIESVVEYFNESDAASLTKEEKATAVLQQTYASGGRIHPVLKDEGERSIKIIHFDSVKSLLAPGGNMSSKESFQAWLNTDDFKAWFTKEKGGDYTGETDLSKMTIANVQELVELAFPMTKGMRTIYSDVNSGQFELSQQMATLLKDGKLPEATYALDSNPVAPID